MSNSDFLSLLTQTEDVFIESLKDKSIKYFNDNNKLNSFHLFKKISLKDLFKNKYHDHIIFIPSKKIQYNKESFIDIDEDFLDFYSVSLKVSNKVIKKESAYLDSLNIESHHIKKQNKNIDYIIKNNKLNKLKNIELINVNLDKKYFNVQELFDILNKHQITRFNIQDNFCILIREHSFLSLDFIIYQFLSNNYTVDEFLALKKRYTNFFDRVENIPYFHNIN